MLGYVDSLGITFCIFSMLAYSFALPLSAGVLFAGQMGTMALAAYVTAITLKAGWPFVAAAALALLSVLALAALLARPALRLGELSMAIVSLGVSQVIVTFASNLEITGQTLGIRNIPVVVSLPLAGVLLLGGIGLIFVAQRLRLLHNVRLVREDPRVAQACGIDVRSVRVLALFAGALVSGLAGILYAGYLTYISPAAFGFQTLLQIIALALVGGVSSPLGPLLGTALLWGVPQFVPIFGEWRFVVYGVAVIVFVTWRPNGLLDDLEALARGRRRELPGTG